jgi:hypothetical protein
VHRGSPGASVERSLSELWLHCCSKRSLATKPSSRVPGFLEGLKEAAEDTPDDQDLRTTVM